jgi:hypothetical protein
VPENAFLIVSVGESYKYGRTERLDFVATLAEFIRNEQDIFLLVVGVASDLRWDQATSRCAGRMKAVGRKSDVQRYLLAADLYIEGFPFGSTTALLEAGVVGLPAVLAPSECPPPYGSDGVAIDEALRRPLGVSDYIHEIRRLRDDRQERMNVGQKFQAAVLRHHCCSGWLDYAGRLMEMMPIQHCVRSSIQCRSVPDHLCQHWNRVKQDLAAGPERALDAAIRVAFAEGVKLKLDREVRVLCTRFRAVRYARCVPSVMLHVFCGIVAPVLPAGWRKRVYEELFTSCRVGSKTMPFLQRMIPYRLW